MTARSLHDYRKYDWNINHNQELSRQNSTMRPTVTCLPSHICDLQNDIRPIFCESNFPGARYEVLRPMLQLASLLIDTDCLLDFWHAVFFGKKRIEYDIPEIDIQHIEYSRQRLDLSAKQQAETRLKLRALSHMFRFYRDANMGSLNGTCFASDSNILSSMNEIGLFPHATDYIRYNDDNYQRLCDLHDKATGPCVTEKDDGDYCNKDGPSGLYPAYFHFAKTLVHEVAHAAAFAEMGCQYQAVFEGSAVAEHGYDWENHVFGGLLGWCVDEQGELIMGSCSWPSTLVVNHCEHNNCMVWRRECYVPNEVEAQFHFPLSHVRQFFQSHFWDVVVPESGGAALLWPMYSGQRVEVNEPGEAPWFSPLDTDAERFDGVPEGWYAEGYLLFPIDKSAGITAEGFGRLMRINVEGIWGEAEKEEEDDEGEEDDGSEEDDEDSESDEEDSKGDDEYSDENHEDSKNDEDSEDDK